MELKLRQSNLTNSQRVKISPDPKGIKRIAKSILRNSSGKATFAKLPFLSRVLMKIAMRDKNFRLHLFRLVDVFPSLTTDDDLFLHLLQYLGKSENNSGLIATLLEFSKHIPLGKSIVLRLVRNSFADVANLFIAGQSPTNIIERLKEYDKRGINTTVDILGEKTLTEKEADSYEERVSNLANALDHHSQVLDDSAAIKANTNSFPKVSVSIKPTALSPHFSPLMSELAIPQVKDRLEKIFTNRTQVLFFLDMEDFDVKDLTLDLVEELAVDLRFLNNQFGLVVQAYLRTSQLDLGRVIELSRKRLALGGTPLWIRLVKGAYYDSEVAISSSQSWQSPTFIDKEQTDFNFERCVDLVLKAHPVVIPAFGTHNLRSISYVIAKARDLKVPIDAFEIQMLYGMAEQLANGVHSIVPGVRLYLPMGELIPGMSYLVRRLIENTANDSFLRQGSTRFWKRSYLRHLQAPKAAFTKTIDHESLTLESSYHHEPTLMFRDPKITTGYNEVLNLVRDGGLKVIYGDECKDNVLPLVIDGTRYYTAGLIDSLNPAEPNYVIAKSSTAGLDEVKLAMQSAASVAPIWANTPVTERATILMAAASWLETQKQLLGALEVLEAGKPWKEADADICEAIDYLHFYANAAVGLFGDKTLDCPIGELNRQIMRPRGTTAVIGPWNFPLAIPMGMTSAALVTGNCVLLKPAEQTPAVAFAIIKAFEFAGIPSGVINFLPGNGEITGVALVEQVDIATIAFTGSYPVGTSIIKSGVDVESHNHKIKRVIAEMGGKNPIIVDADADLDQVVPGVIYSAFGFSGQKCSACSRLIVHSSHANELIDRLEGALQALVIGDPSDPSSQIGPLIDQASVDRVELYVARAESDAKVIRYLGDFPQNGYYVRPTLVIEPPRGSRILIDEIFGPILCVEIVSSFDEAIERANDTYYALTAGVYSRSLTAIRLASKRLVAGNIYINRPITGAIPGRQPFGGFNDSGVGYKAGSIEYLLQFCNQVIISENTIRSGFVPDLS